MGGNGQPSQDPQESIKLELPLPHVPQQTPHLIKRGFSLGIKRGCAKATVRVIRLAVSLWQLADMVTDWTNTLMCLHFAEVNKSLPHFRQP